MRSTTRKLESGARLALAGLRLNAILCTVKIAAGALGHSYALIADGFESLLDVVSSLLIWAGLKYAQRPPDEDHPYGHGKAEPVAAILGSVTILAAGAALVVNSMRALFLPRATPAPFTLLVLVAAVIFKAVLSRRVKRLAMETGSTAIDADATHHQTDALTSLAAAAGISVALIGGRKYGTADNWAALFACAIIAYNGLRILWPALWDLMDTAPPTELQNRVCEAASKVEGVAETEQCRIRKMGLEFYVDLHVKVDGGITVREGHGIAHQVKDAVKRELPEVVDVLVHVEPARVGKL